MDAAFPRRRRRERRKGALRQESLERPSQNAPDTVTDARILETHAKTTGDLSSSWGRVSLTLTPKSGCAAATLEVRFTSLAVKRAGKWLYLVDHASMPAGPPSPPAR